MIKETITSEVLSQKHCDAMLVDIFDKQLAFILTNEKPHYGTYIHIRHFYKDVTDVNCGVIEPYVGGDDIPQFIGEIRKKGREKKQKFILFKPKNNKNIFLVDLSKHHRKTEDIDLGEFDVNKLLHYFSLMVEKNVVYAEIACRNLYSPLILHAMVQKTPHLKLQYPDVTRYFVTRKFIEILN